MNAIKGYSLFNDVEDTEIRIYNRARSMKNIMIDHADKDKNVSVKGTHILLQYMNAIPTEERRDVYIKLEELLKVKEVV